MRASRFTAWMAAIALGTTAAAGGIEEARSRLERQDWRGAYDGALEVIDQAPRRYDAHLVAGIAARHLGELRRAERHLERVYRAAPQTDDIPLELGRLRMDQAEEIAERRQRVREELHVEALALFDEQLARAPGHSGALEGRTRALVALGRVDQAVAAHEQWIEADPEQAASYTSVVDLLLEQGRDAEALALAGEVAGPGGDAAVAALYGMARDLYAEGRADEARELLADVRSRSPRSWQAHALSSLDLLDRDRPFEAADELLRFVAAAPSEDSLGELVAVYHTQFSRLARERAWRESGDWELPRSTLRHQPNYPARARDRGIDCSVLLLAVIDEQGIPVDIRPVVTEVEKYAKVYTRDFNEAAVEAISAWRYEPARRDGQAVPFPLTVRLAFSSR